jgi:hypothetical protein
MNDDIPSGQAQTSPPGLDSVIEHYRERQFQVIYDKLAINGQRNLLADDAKLLLAVSCIQLGRVTEVSPLLGGAGPTERMLARCDAVRGWPAQDRQLLARYLMLRNPQDGDRVFLSTFPKSGSTFLSECILEINKTLSREQVSSNNTLMQMTMDSIMLTRAMGRPNTLVKTHLACNIKLQAYLVLYDTRPVVLIRNIFDVLRSFIDHLSTSYPGIIAGYPELSFEDKKNVVIHLMAMPLVEFFATWQMYAARNRCLIVRYEDIVDDWVSSIRQILEYSRIDASPSLIASSVEHLTGQLSVDPGRFRYNAGVKGRGADFTEEEKERVRRLYKMYPRVDFRIIDDDA